MIVAESVEDVRRGIAAPRAAGRSIALVPTMGALHEGHFSLIAAASARCDFVVVSIFVNPLQFGPGEDLSAYPRPREVDLAACEQRGVDVVFYPPAEVMYARQCLTAVHVTRLSEPMCGRDRPGHFAGVCTVVAKLLNIVQPDVAFFGAKDYQQAAIVRRMVLDLSFPVRIEVCPTVREPDGLAMSSRNAYLTDEQRRQATALIGSLRLGERMIRTQRPAPSPAAVEAAIRRHLADEAPGGEIDYVQLADPEELSDVERTDRGVVIALAVRFGRARLIDNIVVDRLPADR